MKFTNSVKRKVSTTVLTFQLIKSLLLSLMVRPLFVILYYPWKHQRKIWDSRGNVEKCAEAHICAGFWLTIFFVVIFRTYVYVYVPVNRFFWLQCIADRKQGFILRNFLLIHLRSLEENPLDLGSLWDGFMSGHLGFSNWNLHFSVLIGLHYKR